MISSAESVSPANFLICTFDNMKQMILGHYVSHIT